MTEGDRAQPSPDPATLALRQRLLKSDDDKARLHVLEAIAKRKVFAATWPHSPDSVRTLTNSDGEHAMPVFSGMDTLLQAAKRFGWGNRDGSLCFRELAGREVLNSALEHDVHCVVLDIYAEHSVEFARTEIGDVLKKLRAAQAAAAKEQQPARQAVGRLGRRSSGPLGAGRKRPAAGLAEIDAPFANERTTGKLPTRAAIEEAAIRRRQDAARRIDPRVEPMSTKPARNPTPQPKRAPRARPEAAPARPHVLRAPSTLREQRAAAEEQDRPPSGAHPQVDPMQQQLETESERPARATTEEYMGLPDFPESPTPRTFAKPMPQALRDLPLPAAASAFGRAPARPGRPARVTAEEYAGLADFPESPTPQTFPQPMPQALPDSPVRPAAGAFGRPQAQAQPERAAAARPVSGDRSPTVPDLPAVSADADANAPTGPGDEREPQARPGALAAAAMVAQVAKPTDNPSTQRAAAEVAALLKDMARKGAVEEAKPSTAQSAAKVLAGLLTAELAADAQRSKRGKQAAAAPAAPEPAEAAPEPVESESGLRPPEHALADAVIEAISDALRRFPEVEWACEISDGSPQPVVGVRVDPSFLTRMKEIKAGVLAAASSQKTALTVLMLTDAPQLKDARTHGNAFFPWRRRAAKR